MYNLYTLTAGQIQKKIPFNIYIVYIIQHDYIWWTFIYIDKFDKFDKFIFIISQTHEEIHVE